MHKHEADILSKNKDMLGIITIILVVNNNESSRSRLCGCVGAWVGKNKVCLNLRRLCKKSKKDFLSIFLTFEHRL